MDFPASNNQRAMI